MDKNEAWKKELERTLVVLKPDAVKRGLVGRIIQRFERVGLKLVGCKMVQPTQEAAKINYPDPQKDQDWVRGMGEKTLKTYGEYQRDVVAELGTADPYELGLKVYEKLIEYWTSGPVVIMVWQGHQAVKIVRDLAGPTTPTQAPPGTIRGDFSFDSQILANVQGRVVMRNLIHVSSDLKEAEREMKNWFGSEAQFEDYERVDYAPMFY
jgi:nucleoside-diphosphate kinase